MGDDQHAHVGALRDGVDAGGDGVERVDVEAGVGLVEHRQRRLLSASWRISMRFFSPPEKPSLRYRLENSFGTFVSSIAASTVLRNSLSEIGSSPRRLAVRVDDHAQVLGDGHAGDRDRVLEGHEQARAGALVGIGLGDVLALEEDLALGDLEVRMTHDRVRQRGLARAVRAHQRVELAGADV